MNLVLSGSTAESLLPAVETISRPLHIRPVRPYAWRLEHVKDSEAIRIQIATWCASAAVDHAFVAPGIQFSDMKVLALDMDSTLITIECIDELADYAGKKNEVAAITEATMRGEIQDFEESLRRRVALLRGLDANVLRLVYNERLRLSPGATPLIDAAHESGLYILLVSGGFTYFADRLKKALCLDAAFANRLESSDGRLTGRVIGPIVDAQFKAERVAEAMRQVRCAASQAIVVGDGANDIPMMRCAEYSIAYHAKLAVRKIARLQITYGDLATTLAYFQ